MTHTTCKSPRCQNRSWRKDGWCTKHAEANGLRKPNQPAQPTIDALRTLYESGWTQAQIEETTGITSSTQYNLTRGKYTTVRHTTAVAVKSLIGTHPHGGHLIPAWPYTRRLQALQAAGHTGLAIADHTGISQALISKLSLGKQTTVGADVAAKIAEYWQSHAYAPVTGPPTAAAKRLLWAPPLEWDDIDDPNEHHPAMSARVRLTDGQRALAGTLLAAYSSTKWPFTDFPRDTIKAAAAGRYGTVTRRNSDFIYRESERIKSHNRERHRNAA